MQLFGPPNVEKLKAKGNVKGLIKALGYEEDKAVREAAAIALGEISDPRAVEALIAALKDGDTHMRRAAAEALVKIGAPVVEPLITTLKDESWVVRIFAIAALSGIGDARAVEPLITTLKDENTRVRGAAAVALGKIGDPQAVGLLIAALRNGNATAAVALGAIGDPRAVEPLIAALKDKAMSVRGTAAGALVKIGAPAVGLLIAALEDENHYVREGTAKALGEIGDPRAVEPLIVALKDNAVPVRRAAAGALDKLGWRPDRSGAGAAYWVTKCRWNMCVEIGAPAVGLLIAVLKGLDKDVRQAAAGALGQIGTPAVKPLIAALKDKDRHVREGAAKALGEIGDPRAVEPLIAVLKDRDKDVRQAAAGALDRFDWPPDRSKAEAAYRVAAQQWDRCVEIGTPAVEPLIVALEDENYYVRRGAAGALGEIGDLRGVEPLIAALTDGDMYVRKAADEALRQIGTPAVEPLIAALTDGNAAAARALGEIGDGRAVEPLITALKDGNAAAAMALEKIGDVRAVEPLIAALEDENHYVRQATAKALDNLGWRPDRSETGAVYWIAKGQWDKCVEIGAPAVESLIAALKKGWSAAAGALGEIGDARAVEPLIAALKGRNEYVREAAAKALGESGDVRAAEPLIAALKGGNAAAAGALDKLGWQPDRSETGAAYWIVKRQWDRCVDIGVSAVGPLSAALKDGNAAAAGALGKIGTPAVEPLVAALYNKRGSVRRPAAEALVALYRSGKLDAQVKQKILAMRSTMAESHHDYSPSNDCTDHQDRGIGVTF